MAVFTGTNLSETIYGTMRADNIDGWDGHDRLYGRDGNDWLGGDWGDDIVEGGKGDDYLDGSEGNDVLRGGAGDDWIFASFGQDQLFGGEGNDVLRGVGMGDGRDILYGGNGNDTLYGADGTMFGGSGRDTLETDMSGLTITRQTGGGGADVFSAIASRDGNYGRVEVLDFSPTEDRFSLQANLGGDSPMSAEDVFDTLDTSDDGVLNGSDQASSLGSVKVGTDSLTLTFVGDDFIFNGAQSLADWQMVG
jgi:Ca2+-binding RTX toxin-like protein